MGVKKQEPKPVAKLQNPFEKKVEEKNEEAKKIEEPVKTLENKIEVKKEEPVKVIENKIEDKK